MDENRKISDLTVKEFLSLIKSNVSTKSKSEKFIPRLDAALLLKVTPKTIDRWCSIGVLGAKVKIGGRSYIKSSSIDQKLKG